ncbi:uncharacterized protein LOC127437961 [Myxocyprinus asiaticus]|uniref:uncharacterized protein LOC127437961 n=1 Tax=Myxocyprinus asiaticus TaxID=70543 RepID=UPI002223446F|nr:uncharacterized protein LOC127437961 [Myxocyprinus asiaticus]
MFMFLVLDVFGVETDRITSVSVMEGDSVTLYTDLTEIQTDDQILWRFGPENSRIAEIYKLNIPKYDRNERFRDKLMLDRRTGSLSIGNINKAHAGPYKLTIFSNTRTSHKRFTITVYARLPIPVIIRDSSQSSSSCKCVLVCSVVNVTQVTLSWYKGNSLFSSISVSDVYISLSLPLEVEYQENNIYSCVLNNHIRNQTKHLNITEVCQTLCQILTYKKYFLY